MTWFVNAPRMALSRQAPYLMFPRAIDDAVDAIQRVHLYPWGSMFESIGMITRHAVEEP